MTLPEQTKEEKQRAFLERARKGVLQFLNDKGGKLAMAEMHDFSMNKYLIQHQGFSQMMEWFVDQGFVEFDWSAHEAILTETGKEFLKTQNLKL